MLSATSPTTVATGMRSPRMHGTPSICLGLTVMRVNFMALSSKDSASKGSLRTAFYLDGCLGQRIVPALSEPGTAALEAARIGDAPPLLRHRLLLGKRHPAARDAVEHPQPGQHPDHQRGRNAEQRDERHPAPQQPQERVPERADLPAEMRI